VIIIFDRAHGIDVKGKRSPDNKLIEWEWSHLFISLVMARLSNYDVFDLCPFIHYENEPGLSTRVNTYNSLVDKYGEALVISPHVNAAPGDGWINGARGFEIWTSPGQDKSDEYADIFLQEIANEFPDIHIREDRTDGDIDKEANFTVLTGFKLREGKYIKAKYHAVLIENLFMNNEKEVELLLDPDFNDKLADAYVRSILKICPET
jgi:N-acetylmuramoyl-L-alanine amidase